MNIKSLAQKSHLFNNVLKIYFQALPAVNSYSCINQIVSLNKEQLCIRASQNQKVLKYDLTQFRSIYLVGCGKASAGMTVALDEILGQRLTAGIISIKYGHFYKRAPRNSNLVFIEAGHPFPDNQSEYGAIQTLSLLAQAKKNDLILAVISGGGSALWALPESGISLSEKIATTKALLQCGADIHEVNCIRSHISRIKGGQAAMAAAPAQVIVLEISDVRDDDPRIIASGPFAESKRDYNEVMRIIRKYDLSKKLPTAVVQYIKRNVHKKSTSFPDLAVKHCICASNSIFLAAASAQARALGYVVSNLGTIYFTDINVVAENFLHQIQQLILQYPNQKQCLISGGEPTVTLTNDAGKGGRNMALCLLISLLFKRHYAEYTKKYSLVICVCGTDGTDGPTDAAGAILDLSVYDSSNYAIFSQALEAAKTHNAYPFFDKINGLVKSGPTNTNVMDVQIALIEPKNH